MQVVNSSCKNESPGIKQEVATAGKRASHPALDASDLVSVLEQYLLCMCVFIVHCSMYLYPA